MPCTSLISGEPKSDTGRCAESLAFWDRAGGAGHSFDALKRLEYRGYDSAGVATLERRPAERRLRAEGKLENLEAKLERRRSRARSASATRAGRRTASRREPTRIRTRAARVAVVHNGIIENFQALREELIAKGHRFATETDTGSGGAPGRATNWRRARSRPRRCAAALKRLRGAFALVYLFAGEDDLLIGARQGAPLAVGYGDGEMFSAPTPWRSPPSPTASPISRRATGRSPTRAGATFHDASDARRRTQPIHSAAAGAAGRQGQLPPLHGEGNPRAAGGRRPHARPLRRHGGAAAQALRLAGRSRRRSRASSIIACGTAYMRRPRRQILDRALRPPAGRDRRRLRVPLPRAAGRQERAGDRHLAVGRDRRHARGAALRQGERRQDDRPIVNVPDLVDRARKPTPPLPTLAGPEIGVASTKAFTCQLAALACLAIGAGARARRHRPKRRRRRSSASSSSRAGPARPSAASSSRSHRGDRRTSSPAPATCSISAAAPPIRSRSKAR